MEAHNSNILTAEEIRKINEYNIAKAKHECLATKTRVEIAELDAQIAKEESFNLELKKKEKKIQLLNLKADNKKLQESVTTAYTDLWVKTGKIPNLDDVESDPAVQE